MYTLGTPFFKGYYTVYDLGMTAGTSRIGFAPHSDSKKPAL